MSSIPDVNYSHKKFKKATLDACERKEAEVKTVTLPHNSGDGQSLIEDKQFFSCNCLNNSKCLQAFCSKGDCLRYKVQPSNHVQEEVPLHVRRAALLSRSTSLLDNPDTHDQTSTKTVENESTKPIYKPKFRAQYSTENISIISQDHGYPDYNSLISRANTYHASLVSPHTSSDQLCQISVKTVSNDDKKGKCDIATRPTCSQNLWKGIKSPSPKEMGQHIAKLIVDNKAIVDTHNPFWPMRNKRLSSVASILDEESLNKVKKSPSIKWRNYSRPKSPQFTQHSINIDDKSQSNIPSSNQTIYSAVPIHPLTIVRQVKYDAKHLNEPPSMLIPANVDTTAKYCSSTLPSDSVGHRITMHTEIPEVSITDQLSISLNHPVKKNTCLQCGMLINSTIMPHHQKYSCKKTFLVEFPIKGDNQYQGDALDLQTKRNIFAGNLDTTPFLETIIEKEVLDERIEQTVVNYPYKICKVPNKKCNMMQSMESDNVIFSAVSLSNGDAFSHKKVGIRNIDELHKPKLNSDHIYGGEVKICDGNAFKTLIIDSIKSERSSLDLCIASKHLGSTESLNDSTLPTSIVVNFARSGLNSGGTMVKVNNKKCSHAKIVCSSSLPSPFSDIPEESNVAYKKSIDESNPLSKNTSFSLIHASSLVLPLQSENVTKASSSLSHITVTECSILQISNPTACHESHFGQDLHQSCSKILNEEKLIMSADANYIPYIPGIPGPYSQPNTAVPLNLPLDHGSESLPAISNCSSLSKAINHMCLNPDKVKQVYVFPSKRSTNKLTYESSSVEGELIPGEGDTLPELIDSKESRFLVPRKRPCSLPIKSSQVNPKSSLIGSTLISPDTPRPKKSCAQFQHNGSAYTYLNMKVSTKTFFCCIYRPQPMYVLQATNPKLSMYSNWQVRKTVEKFNLSPIKLMESYIFNMYHDRAYTIAKPSVLQMIIKASNTCENGCITVPSCHGGDSLCEKFINLSDSGFSKRKLEDDLPEEGGLSKRVKIFQGGFKTNEDYTYVRGRGRGRYMCETCSIRCKKPSMLKKHIRTHTDLRPFACIHCSFSFKTKGNLTKHLKSKAHYKRCTEMGIRPVPTVVDDTHINKEALQLQGKIDVTLSSCHSADDDDDSDSGNEESDDDEFDEFNDEDKTTDSLHEASTISYDSFPMQNGHFESAESPMDLSVKRADEKYKPPRNLYFASKSSITPVAVTPIMEKAEEILSLVTESSHLLKSIYDTTLKISQKVVTSDPYAEHGCGGSMLQKYLREIAVLNSARKRKFIHVAESYQEVRLKKPKVIAGQEYGDGTVSDGVAMQALKSVSTTNSTTITQSSSARDIAAAIVVSCVSSYQGAEAGTIAMRAGCSSPCISSTMVLKHKKRESSPITYRSSQCFQSNANTRVNPSVPANMVVINTSGTDSKTAFMSPSGVIPMLNRSGCDDGKSKCSICQKEFGKQSQLSLHMNIHYIERPHRCESCGVSFRTNGHLQKHMRSVSHYNKLNMNMTFGTPSTENPRPFKCHDCKSAFRIHGHLAKHLRSKLHIMRLECLGKIPFGTYAEIERSGFCLNEIDTSDCQNSLDSLQVIASKLYEKDPKKLTAWTEQSKAHRVRTVSNSSNNSDDYPLEDEQDQMQAENETESYFDEDFTEISIEADTNPKETNEDLESDLPLVGCSY